MSRVFYAKYEHLGLQEISKREEAYQASVDNWNSNKNKNLALLERYFGTHQKTVFFINISPKFVQYGLEIMNISENYNERNSDKYQKEINSLSDIIYKFDFELLNAIKNNEIGVFINK
jgi:lipase chaperone LimK